MAGPKPVASPTPVATNANFSAGPDIGTASKVAIPGATQADGFIPGDKPPAQHHNFLFNEWYLWLDWVDQGASAANLDAHIVETDSTGQANVASMNLGGTAFATAALDVDGNTAGAAASITNLNGNFGLTCTASGSLAAGRFTNTGTGPAVQAIGLGTDNNGIECQGTGIGNGVEGDGGSSGGAGGVFTSGDASSAGVQARMAAAGTTSGAAVDAVATGDGRAVYAEAVDGYCVECNPGTERAPIHLGTLGATAPNTVQEGDFGYESLNGQLYVRTGSQVEKVQHNFAGLFADASDSPNPGGSTAGATQQSSVAITVNPGGVVQRYLIRAVVFLNNGNDDGQAQVDINNGSGDIWSQIVKHPPVGAAVGRGITVVAEVIVSISASTTYTLQLTNLGSFGQMTWSDGVISYTALD